MDDGVDMKIMKIGYVLLIGIAAFLALPAHGAESDSEALRKCIQVDDEMTIHYNCEEPATVEFCYEDIVMKPNAADIDIRLAKDMLCRSGDGFHDPCHFFGPGKCHNIEMQAWARRIAGYTVVYGVCPDVGNSLEWVSNPGSSGQYVCRFGPMENVGSDDGSDGGAETLSEDDLYERLFGEYENTLSVLLDGDLSSDEILGILLVELLGGELSFDDALGNIGKGQTESSDQGKEQVASDDQRSKQSSLSALSAACKEYLDAAEHFFEQRAEYPFYISLTGSSQDDALDKIDKSELKLASEKLKTAFESVGGVDISGPWDAVSDVWWENFNTLWDEELRTEAAARNNALRIKKLEMSAFLNQAGLCGY